MKRALVFVICASVALLASAAHVRAQCQVAKVTAPAPVQGDNFGCAAAIEGDWAIIGASLNDDRAFQGGAAFVFHRVNGVWAQTQELLASDGTQSAKFGAAVAMSGNWAVIGAYTDFAVPGIKSGSAYTFERVGNTWIERSKLIASDASYDAQFGFTLAISGDRILIGARAAGPLGWFSGEAYVFERFGSTWLEVAALIPSDGAGNDAFGVGVAIDGDRLVVGAWGARTPTLQTGAAYVYERSIQGNWTLRQKLIPSNGLDQDLFGATVAISGSVIGVSGAYHGSSPGTVYFFNDSGLSWVEAQQVNALDPISVFPYSGFTLVSLRGDTAVMSANQDPDMPVYSGATYLFKLVGASWVQVDKLVVAEGLESDLALPKSFSGTTVLVGAASRDEACPQVVGCNSGAAYFFEMAPTTIQYGSCPTGAPCANADSHGGCRNSTGQGAILQARGSGSCTTDDMVMEVQHLPPFAPGLIFMGGAQASTPFGDGRLVVGDSGIGIYRIEIHFADADGTFLHGPGKVALTQGIPNPLGHIQAGQTWNYQCWYRDQQGPCGSGFNLTNGLAVSYVP